MLVICQGLGTRCHVESFGDRVLLVPVAPPHLTENGTRGQRQALTLLVVARHELCMGSGGDRVYEKGRTWVYGYLIGGRGRPCKVGGFSCCTVLVHTCGDVSNGGERETERQSKANSE